MSILLHPTYFPSISQMVAVAQNTELTFEVFDNYQKQTYRSRTYIAHSNGRLLLNVPIKHSKDGTRQKTSEVKIENNFSWQLHHWKSLQSAYRTSPFFEFYEDDLAPIFKTKAAFLLEHNLKIFKVLSELIGLEIKTLLSTEYEQSTQLNDLRYLAIKKKERTYPLDSYTQVLEEKHGFLPNLSVLDLLFNEGPNTLHYLKSQNIKF
jgi:hypothetical protein